MPEHALVQQAYKNLGPWARADESGHLLAFLKVLLDPLLVMDDIARDGTLIAGPDEVVGSPTLILDGDSFTLGDDTLGFGASEIREGEQVAYMGWGSILDVDVAPVWALPWLAQLVGVRTIAGLDEESQRIRIKEASGFHRGTPSAIIAAAKQYLIGRRKVDLFERDGSPWRFKIRTYLSETPDPEKVRDAVEALKPAGLVFIYEVQEGIEINGLVGTIDSQASTIDSYSVIVPV